MKRTTQLSFNHRLTFAAPRRKRRGRWLLAALLLLIAAASAYWISRQTPPTSETAPVAAQPVLPVPAAAPAPPPAVKVEVAYVVRPNDTLGEIFSRLKLDVADLPAVLTLPAVRDGFKPLQPGDELRFTLVDGVWHRIDRRISETESLSIERKGNGFAADVHAMPITTQTAHVRGGITASRIAAGLTPGLSPEIMQQLANDVFAWDIDFALDVRPGDRFNVVYEQKFRDGEYLGDGRILAAEFINRGDAHRAVRYTSADGKIDGYFTPDGQSVRRTFLRTPLDFTQVRAEPSTAVHRLVYDTLAVHHGSDYPAPVGTAVKAAGDGRIRFVGTDGDYGNTVVIDHGKKISTLYGDLSGFARGLQTGRPVKQGEVIGYVGRSGTATAPHLHFEYRIDGKSADPPANETLAAAAVPGKYLADFRAKSAALLDALKQPGGTVVTTALAD